MLNRRMRAPGANAGDQREPGEGAVAIGQVRHYNGRSIRDEAAIAVFDIARAVDGRMSFLEARKRKG
ncbi:MULTISPECIES: hypothetical protein [Methylobacterium]|uniref:hypothetical protein n=1 Tax=Methylobacterium TaxID=407 RepID=UPI0013EB2F08|nr:hypothetical protein [Methylobacterium sp. DB0501]NGM37019.1 hypothetical protein [Methylobacterium sp. DB0501]